MSYGLREPERPFGDVGGLSLAGGGAGSPPAYDQAADFTYEAPCGCRVVFSGRRRHLDWTCQHCLAHARPEGAEDRAAVLYAARQALAAAQPVDDELMTVAEYLARVGNKHAPVPRGIIEADRRRPSDASERASRARQFPGAGSRGSAFQGKDG